MKIELYKSLLCPRCAYATHILKKLQQETNGLEIVTYDIATDFKTFKNANISMIPTLKIENEKKSWLLPNESEIRDFVLNKR